MARITNGSFYAILDENPGLCEIGDELTGNILQTNPAKYACEWTLYNRRLNAASSYQIPQAEISFFCEEKANTAVWKFMIPADFGKVSGDISLSFSEKVLRFELCNVEESGDACLLTVRLNGLSAAVQQDAASRLAMPSHGGRLIDPAKCADGQTDHRYNWILDSFGSAAVVYTTRLTSVTRIHLMDDQLTTLVSGENGSRYAQVGALLRYRYCKQDISYKRAMPDRDPANTEDSGELPIESDFSLAHNPYVTVSLISHEPVQPESGWIYGATLVRDSLPGKRTDYYRDKMVYKIFVGAPNQPVSTNLEQIRNLVFDVAARTGNAGQVSYLVGFQHKGHDSLYPDVYTLNPALESIEKLAKLVEDAKKINCYISFHDNYDDAYADSPSWNADEISRDHTGHLLRGGVWNSVQAYWNSMPYYAKIAAEKRIERTLQTYPFIKDTYHLDVLTASVFRIDFRKGEPSGREADKQGRLRIVDMFREKGIDVTSEACGLPFIGSISYFWHMQRVARSLYEGDSRIPMIPFLVHGKADYAGTHTDCLHSIQDGLLYGGFYCNDVTAATSIKNLTDAYFMLQAPLNLIRDDFACGYEEKNGWKTVRYQSGAYVSVNFETCETIVEIGGKRLIENGSAMIPCPDGSTILYRCEEEPYADVQWQTGDKPGTLYTLTPIGVNAEVRTVSVNAKGCIAIDTELGIAYRSEKKEV